MKNYSIRVYGKVQGVFFRANTVRMATGYGITGWVKNEADGSVSICAQGIENKLMRLLKWCETGSEYASVSKVDCIEKELEVFKSFRIIH